MNKETLRKHLEESVEIMKTKLSKLTKQVEEMKPTVTIDNIGQFVKLQIEVIKLEEELKQAIEQLD